MSYYRTTVLTCGFLLSVLCAACLGSAEIQEKHSRPAAIDLFLRQAVKDRCSHEALKGGERYPNFSDNPRIDDEMRSVIEPFLLPLDSPLKPILDSIFSTAKVADSKQSLRDAGFHITFDQKRFSHIIVARHPKLPKYLFKLYLNSEQSHRDGQPEWKWLTTRCAVAEKIRNIITENGIRHFTVPDKWLYPLPPDRKKGHYHPVVLIVTDMNIQDRPHSCKAWKNQTTKEHLRELFQIMGRGYGSACLDKNVPYTNDGTFAFIDTEFDERKLPLKKMKRFFSPKMQRAWKETVKKSRTHA